MITRFFKNRPITLVSFTAMSQRAHDSNSTIVASQHVSDELCMICSLVNTRKRMKECANCNFWAHLSCAKLTRVQADNLPIWHCQPCLSRGTGDSASVATDTASLNVPPEGWQMPWLHSRSKFCYSSAFRNLLGESWQKDLQ